MATANWPTKPLSVASLHLDPKNPRLGRETSSRAPRDIIQYLFDHDKALEVAQSIANRGYFPNEPLLAIVENGRYVVVEGNRRLAALKVLREPGLLEGVFQRKVERLSNRSSNREAIAKVPVTIAPSRRATDLQLVGRHIGTPVRAWEAENRASFILEKLEEGYDNKGLREDLGFTQKDIQEARQTRAIADMARSLDLPDEVKVKLDKPRPKIFTTIERVFNSGIGRDYLMVQPDPDHGLRGDTTKSEFLRGFKKLVSDIALGHQDSRTLNKPKDIEDYFKKWQKDELPKKKSGTFVPSDIIKGKSVASPSSAPKDQVAQRKPKPIFNAVLPKDLKVIHGKDRLKDIRYELTRLKRDDYPNAGAVLLRVFFELSIVDYLERTGDLKNLVHRLKSKNKLPHHGMPKFRNMLDEIKKISKKELNSHESQIVEKAIRHDPSAPFSISELHAFVHSSDFPISRDIFQFWKRTEPLFRLMLEKNLDITQK